MPTTVVSVKMVKSEGTTKKFMNKPEDVVDDAIRGLTEYNPNVTVLNNCARVVIRRNLHEGAPSSAENTVHRPKSGTFDRNWPNVLLLEKEHQRLPYFVWGSDRQSFDKVALIAGGGSGHEPFPAGYVGQGMLTAAVCGNVFASPPSSHIQAALEASHSNAGTVLFVINYTGDRLNFGLAGERYKAQGNEVRIVTIADDIAIDTSKTRTGARGLAGSVLVLKIAGALAEDGSPIDVVETMAKETCQHIRTLGCSLNACSIPGKGPMLRIPAGEFELGLGIHGEAGKARLPLATAKSIVQVMMKELIPKPENEPALGRIILLNNLGSVSQIEMDIMRTEILDWCATRNVQVARFLSGPYMTSLDSHGISITVLDVFNASIIRLIDRQSPCPGWSSGIILKPQIIPSVNMNGSAVNINAAPNDACNGPVEAEPETPYLRKIIEAVCNEMKRREDELNMLDSAAGDGDCGATFKTAADAIEKKLNSKHLFLSSPQKCLEQISKLFENNVGGTSGALYALYLSVFSSELTHVDDNHISQALMKATDALQKYGGAQPGDRTMIDTLTAAINEIQRQGTEIKWDNVAKAAEVGAQNTANLKAAAGRASYTSERVQTKPDAGAMAVAYWMRATISALYG